MSKKSKKLNKIYVSRLIIFLEYKNHHILKDNSHIKIKYRLNTMSLLRFYTNNHTSKQYRNDRLKTQIFLL